MQRWWMEHLEDYDFELHYHPGKANVMADDMRRKSTESLSCVRCARIEHFCELKKMDAMFEVNVKGALLA